MKQIILLYSSLKKNIDINFFISIEKDCQQVITKDAIHHVFITHDF